jgi:hypothetical protein
LGATADCCGVVETCCGAIAATPAAVFFFLDFFFCGGGAAVAWAGSSESVSLVLVPELPGTRADIKLGFRAVRLTAPALAALGLVGLDFSSFAMSISRELKIRFKLSTIAVMYGLPSAT